MFPPRTLVGLLMVAVVVFVMLFPWTRETICSNSSNRRMMALLIVIVAVVAIFVVVVVVYILFVVKKGNFSLGLLSRQALGTIRFV